MSNYTSNYYFKVAVKDWKVSEAIQKYREELKEKPLAEILSSMLDDLQKLLQERKTLQYSIKSEISKIKDFQTTVETEQELRLGSGKHEQTTTINHTLGKIADSWTSVGDVHQKINIKTSSPGPSVSSGIKRKERQEETIIDMRKDKKQYKFIPVMKPSISMNKPRVISSDQETLSDIVEIKINELSLAPVSENTLHYFNKNIGEQEVNACLSDLPKAKTFLKSALEQELENLPSWLWSQKLDFTKEEENEKKLVQTMKLVLTDFYATCLRPQPTPPLNERTPFCEHVIPLIKYSNAVYQLLRVQWAEKSIDANKFIGICMPGEGPIPKKLADGIGKGVLDNKERLIVESSGETDDAHTIEDSLKIVECSIQCLKMDMISNKLASFKTFQKRQILALHYVGDKLSLTSTNILKNGRYSHVLLRSAIIPRTWHDRYNWIKVFELVVKMNNILKEQEILTQVLLEENSSGETEKSNTIKYFRANNQDST
ncbi:hypothetical protein INT45_010796 [Circinella minor]|uniref:Uncharacterized protein n=1 Tax=Circinella minor TaxID=1195481 RepID=A0A8H7RTG9_9FUNG|nr:hypothetical protein INT45_010796 [Circinella minor]